MDPLAFLRYLATMGTLLQVTISTEVLPELELMDPEVCYLRFEVLLSSSADQQTIEEVFDFVRDDSVIVVRRVPADRPTGDDTEVGSADTGPADEPAMPEAGGRSDPGPERTVAPAVAVAQTIRVDSARLDTLIDLVGELVIAQAKRRHACCFGRERRPRSRRRSEVLRIVEGGARQRAVAAHGADRRDVPPLRAGGA